MGWEDAVANVAFAGLQPRWIGVDVDPPNHRFANVDAAHRRRIVGSRTQPTPTLLVPPVEDDLAVTGCVEPSNGDDAIRHGKRHTVSLLSTLSVTPRQESQLNVGLDHRVDAVRKRSMAVRASAPSIGGCSGPAGASVGATSVSASTRVPTVTGHGLHCEARRGEELTDLGGVLNDVQRHAADNHRVQHSVVSMGAGRAERPCPR